MLVGSLASPRIASLAFLVFLAALAGAKADSPGRFAVAHVNTQLVDDVYRLNARVDLELSAVLLDALSNGVDLYVDIDIEIIRRNTWWFDSEVAQLSQRAVLSYYALSRSYVVRNLNTGIQTTYPSLYSALHAIGEVRDLPLLDNSLLDSGEDYFARLRTRIAIEELPLPLRAQAYLSADWRLSSEWYTWSLR